MIDRIHLVIRIWSRFAWVKLLLVKDDLAAVTRRLGVPPKSMAAKRHPVHLGRAVFKSLSPGPLRTRCLPMALVHYRMLIEQGVPAELVIGIPDDADSPNAHAWVELAGLDVGPPPGRGRRAELARYNPGGVVFP